MAATTKVQNGSPNPLSRVLIVLDSIGYPLFIETETPVMDSVGDVHEAFSYGQFTTPSIAAMLMGFLPHCVVKDCFHNTLFTIFLHIIHKSLEAGKQVAVHTCNPLTHPFFTPTQYNDPKYRLHYHQTLVPYTEKAVKHILRLKNPFFAFLHVMETHLPYFDGRKWGDRKRETQKTALRYVDGLLKPLVDRKALEIIVTADHGELFKNEVKWHPISIFDPDLFKVPIIARVRG